MSSHQLVSKESIKLKTGKTVGLISDTHVPKRAMCTPKKVFEIFQDVDYIIHAGDLVDLSVVDELEQLAPVLAVHGNMDGMQISGALPRMNSLRIFDWKIGVMHDPDTAFGFAKMRELAKENSFNVFVYGHTHVANIKWEGKALFINPGSPTNPALIMSKPSVGLLTITKDTISPQIINL